ncbi:MAG: hypothetical protein M1828_005015 [Chrysothrix sp. TS-e1954]|nr:MAG: hypothetical protein M1828_005015 [Chrysothrix sp. TS-e1954]
MAPKRRKARSRVTPKKKPRVTARSKNIVQDSSQSAQPGYDDNDLWNWESILDQQVRNSKTYYKFRWAGKDPKTGTRREDSWGLLDNPQAVNKSKVKLVSASGRFQDTQPSPSSSLEAEQESLTQSPLSQERGLSPLPSSPTVLPGIQLTASQAAEYENFSDSDVPYDFLAGSRVEPQEPTLDSEAGLLTHHGAQPLVATTKVIPDSQNQCSLSQSDHCVDNFEPALPSDQGYESSQSQPEIIFSSNVAGKAIGFSQQPLRPSDGRAVPANHRPSSSLPLRLDSSVGSSVDSTPHAIRSVSVPHKTTRKQSIPVLLEPLDFANSIAYRRQQTRRHSDPVESSPDLHIAETSDQASFPTADSPQYLPSGLGPLSTHHRCTLDCTCSTCLAVQALGLVGPTPEQPSFSPVSPDHSASLQKRGLTGMTMDNQGIAGNTPPNPASASFVQAISSSHTTSSLAQPPSQLVDTTLASAPSQRPPTPSDEVLESSVPSQAMQAVVGSTQSQTSQTPSNGSSAPNATSSESQLRKLTPREKFAKKMTDLDKKIGEPPTNFPKLTVDKDMATNGYIIPMSLTDLAHEMYLDIFAHHRHDIEEFVNDETSTIATSEVIRRIIKQANDVCCHPDLINNQTLTQAEVGTATEADWSTACSSKFEFLSKLFEGLKEKQKTARMIAIFMDSESLIEMTMKFLKHYGCPHRRMDIRKRYRRTNESLFMPEVHIYPSSHKPEKYHDETYDLGIVFEGGAGSSESVIRSSCEAHLGGVRAIVALRVTNSPEMMLTEQDWDLAKPDESRRFVKQLALYRKQAGQVKESTWNMNTAMSHIIDVTAERIEPPWNLPLYSSYSRKLDADETAMEAANEGPTPFTPDVPENDDSSPDEESDQRASRKRPRSPDSVLSSSVPNKTPRLDAEREVSMSIMQNGEDPSDDGLSILSRRQLEDRMALAEDTLDTIQPKHIAAQQDVVKMTRKLALAEKTEVLLAEIRADRDNLKRERIELKREVNAAHDMLATSAVPEQRELAEAKKVAARTPGLEKQIASQQETIAYVTAQYQTASTAAAEAAGTLAELREEVETLKLKASGEARRLHADFKETHQMMSEQSLKKLRPENESLRRALKQAHLVKHEQVGVKTRSVSRAASPAVVGDRGANLVVRPSPRRAGLDTRPRLG